MEKFVLESEVSMFITFNFPLSPMISYQALKRYDNLSQSRSTDLSHEKLRFVLSILFIVTTISALSSGRVGAR